MPSENYDFTPWDSEDDIHKFIPALLLGARAMGGKLLGKIGLGGAKGAAKVGVKGAGAVAGEAATGAAAATEAVGTGAKAATSAANDAVASVAPKPDLGAKMPSAEVTTPEVPAASEPPVPEVEAAPEAAAKKNNKQMGAQMGMMAMQGGAQKKQAQEQRAMDTARRGASIQTGEPMRIAYQLLKDDEDEVPDPHKFKMSPEDIINAYREKAQRIKEDRDKLFEESENVPMGLREKHPGDQTENLEPFSSNRQYFPTTQVHQDATEGIQRRVNPGKNKEGTFEGLPFEPSSYFTRSEPMDIAWRIMKSGLSFPTDDDDDDDKEKKPFFDEEFLAHKKEYEATTSKDDQYTNHILDAGPYWTLDERQKKVVDAALKIPETHPNQRHGISNYAREEAHDMWGHFNHLFKHDSFQIPDHEYDRAETIINNFGKLIDGHMSDPNADQSMEFMDDFSNPEHPWTKAIESYNGPLSTGTNDWQTKNTGEPMGIAYQLLKENDVPYSSNDHPVQLTSTQNPPQEGLEIPCTLCGKSNAILSARWANPIRSQDYTHHMCRDCVEQYDMQGVVHEPDVKLAGSPMEIAYQLLKDEVDVSGQHAAKNDPRFWDVMRHYGKQNLDLVDKPFYPYDKSLGEMSPQVDELMDSYGYSPYYFGGRYPNPDLGKKNYESGHLAIFDPGVEAASFGDEQFTGNWRKVHELGHALGLEDLNAEWGEGRRLGKLGTRTPREMLRAVDWETKAMGNQKKLMEEIGLPFKESEYNRDWNTTIGDAGFRAITGKFTSPDKEGFEPHTEKVPVDIAMRKVRERAAELGLDMDETLRDKRGGSRKVASEPMDIAWRLLKDDDVPDMANFDSPYPEDTRVPELSMDDLFRLLQHPNERIAHKANEEMQMRSMDAEGSNLPYDPMNTPAGEVAAFYEPQFQDLDYGYGNKQPPDMDGDYNEEGHDESYSHERAGDVDEAMPGDIDQHPPLAAKYQHLKETAPPEVSQGFADRIKNYFEGNTNRIKIPELGLDLPPAYSPNRPKGTLYSTDEIMSESDKMNEALRMYPGPTATTGFDDNWQNKLASEPMDIAYQLLKTWVGVSNG